MSPYRMVVHSPALHGHGLLDLPDHAKALGLLQCLSSSSTMAHMADQGRARAAMDVAGDGILVLSLGFGLSSAQVRGHLPDAFA